jgi:hypothetical protein
MLGFQSSQEGGGENPLDAAAINAEETKLPIRWPTQLSARLL